MKKIIKYILLTAGGVLLFVWAKDYADAWRGYSAHGGEYLLLLFPLLWWAIETAIRESVQDIKTLWKEATGDE